MLESGCASRDAEVLRCGTVDLRREAGDHGITWRRSYEDGGIPDRRP